MNEIKNGTIRSANILIEDHGILTSFLDIDYGTAGQGFGGYDLRENNVLATWVQRLLWVFKVRDFADLKGKPCRVETDGLIRGIGHFTEDRWFYPKDMFE